MTRTKYVALARREMIENRMGSLITPAIVSGLMVALTTMSLTSASFGEISLGAQSARAESFGELLRVLADAPADERSGVLSAILAGIFFPVFILLPFIIFFTLLGSLYEDRRDRSFLFWKSMPVSDTEEVLARFLGAAVAPQITVTLITFVGALVLLILCSIIGGLQGGPLTVLWDIGPFLGIWIKSLLYLPITTLWWLPIMGWVLFASAIAPRAPFAWAVLPPVLIIAFEAALFNTGGFAELIGHQLARPLMLEGLELIDTDVHGPQDVIRAMNISLGDVLTSLTEVRFYVGAAIGAGFIWAAIWRRQFTS